MALGWRSRNRLEQNDVAFRRSNSLRPPKVWGDLLVDGESLVVQLSGWRKVGAVSRSFQIPLSSVVRVDHDPGAHGRVATRLRHTRRSRSALFRLGAYHSPVGWSFWSCGMGRNAVVVETSGVRYKFIVVEVAEPARTVALIRAAAGLPEQKNAKPMRRAGPGRSGREKRDEP